MNLFSLILYGAINVAMVVWYLRGKGRYYQFPFWAGVIALGWFYPMAIGGYQNVYSFPDDAYSNGMLFASLCTAGLWFGFYWSKRKRPLASSWLAMRFNSARLFIVGAALSVFGFYFYWKLWNLPEEMLAEGIWSGATTKYLFLANVFKLGFLILWLRYLICGRWWDVKSLAFLIPSLIFILTAALLRGRRAEMMNLVSYIAVSLWFCKRMIIPRGLIIGGLMGGLILVNGIGTYRSIMMNTDLSLNQRVEMAWDADYLVYLKQGTHQSGNEFKNYIYRRQAYAEENIYDYGGYQWNRMVFLYVPAQVFGAAFKESLQIPLQDIRTVVDDIYGFEWHTGTVSTGYADAFGSFWWFGVINFMLIGWIMGTLYRYALSGSFLAILFYVYNLTSAMQAITHETDQILTSTWIYFFAMAFPALFWARLRPLRIREHVGDMAPLSNQLNYHSE